MAEADTEADTMEAAFTVKAVQAVENIDLSRRSRGSNSDSDSDGGDSDFSIDDHNLPWEITEKLLLNENSDIELVQSRGASTVSLWPPPGTRRTRQRQKSGGASTMSQSRSSVFSVAPLTPTPQTIFRGQQIAEEEKEYERMKNMLTKLKYRSKNIRKRVELPVTEASLSSGGSSHGGGLNQYGSGVKHIAVRKLPHNVDRNRNYHVGMTLSSGSGMTNVPRSPKREISSRHKYRKLPSRIVSAPIISMKRGGVRYTMRERNVLIKPLPMDQLAAGTSEMQEEEGDGNEIQEKRTPLETRQRPRTAPLRRSTENKEKQRSQTARPATLDDDALAIGRIFAASTEIKRGLLRLSAGKTRTAISPMSSFGALPGEWGIDRGVAGGSMDRYWNANEMSVTSPVQGMEPWAPNGETGIRRSSSRSRGGKKRRNSTTSSSSTGRSSGASTKTPTKSLTKTPEKTGRKSSTKKKIIKKEIVEGPAPEMVPTVVVQRDIIEQSRKDKTITVGSFQRTKTPIPGIPTPVHHTPVTTPVLTPVSTPVKTTASSDAQLSLSEPSWFGRGATEKEASVVSKAAEAASHFQESVGLYNTTTDGSTHVLFDTRKTHPDHDYGLPERDPTVLLTSPGRLSKTVRKQFKDSLNIPANQLMEERKSKIRSQTLHGSKLAPTVVADGKKFAHQEEMLKKRDEKIQENRRIEIEKEKKRLRQHKRLRRRLAKKVASKTMNSLSRPGTAKSRASSSTNRSNTAGTDGSSSSRSSGQNLSSVMKIPKGTKPPPPGWQEHLDPVSGKTFYVHLKSSITSWDYPTKEPSRKIPPQGLAQGKQAKFQPPIQRKLVQQDWTGYLASPDSLRVSDY